MNRFSLLLIVGGLLLPGCNSDSGPETASSPKTSYVNNSITDHDNLGWLGVTSNPVSESIEFADPDDSDSSVSPGALVLREIFADQVAEEAGLKVGDVVVRVGDDWLPIKDNPTMDFLAKLEDQITAGASSIELGILRSGKYETVSLRHGQTSLDEGLPTQVTRFDQAAQRALQQLAGTQHEDGSFGITDKNPDDQLRITSLVGLAMLASGDDDFRENVNKCLTFLGAEIDARSETESSAAPGSEAEHGQPGAIRISLPQVDLDPLTCSYVLQFLAESQVQMMDPAWMKRIMGLTGAMTSSQSESGGWSSAESASSDESAIDISGTHTTNQALLAMGMWERKGVMHQGDALQRACGFLKQQADARSESSLDRRTKAALSAGTAAALIAINCQPSDPFLKQMIDECMSRAADVQNAPSLSCPGLMSTALVARASGNESWVQFHTAAKIPLVSAQRPDGTFQSSPHVANEDTVGLEDNKHWQAAHFALSLAMQHGYLKKMIGEADTPMLVVRDSSGEKANGAGSLPQGMKMPAGMTGGTIMQLDLNGEGSIEDQIKAKLKEQGIDTSNIKIGTLPGGTLPKSGDQKKDGDQ